MRTQGMKYTDTVMTTYETCWLATGNSWLSLVSREAADIKRLIFAWSSIQKKKLLLLLYCLPASIHFTQTWNKCALACGRKCMCCMCGGHVRCEDFLRVNYSRTNDETYFSDFGVVYNITKYWAGCFTW